MNLIPAFTVTLPSGTFYEIASFVILVAGSIIAIVRWIRARREKKKRKFIIKTLGKFLVEGKQIIHKCYDNKQEAPMVETDKWNEKVFNYLDANLGNDYAQRFQSHEGLPVGVTTLSGERAKIDAFIGTRLARLNQFIAELRQA